MNENKPLGHKSYGHIPHLPGSRMGPADHKCSEGQARIATIKKRDKHDTIICQEKVDGSNVGIAKIFDDIIPLTRSGYRAETSPFKQHHYFDKWVSKNAKRFYKVLKEGERLCGEWMLMAHGTKYDNILEPFIAFDLFDKDNKRVVWDVFSERVSNDFQVVPLITYGDPSSIDDVMMFLEYNNFYGAIDKREGVVWRVERNKIINKQTGERKKVVDFLVKYVRPDKKDGIYLPEVSGKPPVWNYDINKI